MDYSHEINNQWFEKEREETTSKRMPDKMLGNIRVSNPGFGLNVYHNVFSKEEVNKIISVLENNLGDNKQHNWREAMVTTADQPVKKARDCVDFKMNAKALGPVNESNRELHEVYDLVFKKLRHVVDEYSRYWGINVNFYEIFNFVKYEGEGKHFRIHADDGPHYKCAVSAVVYLNDDYEGGEIYFPRLDDAKVKPGYGDIAVFPSNYMYEHASLPIKSGTKYCVVVMTDINDLAHKDNGYGVKIGQDGQII